MANVWAIKSGNWSDTTVWNTGALPGNGDIVAANGYIVTIDMDLVGSYAPAAIRTSNIGGTAGGGFVIASNRQIGDASHTVEIGGSGSTTIAITIYSGDVTFYANVTGGSGSGAYGIRNNSTGTVTVTGNVTGGSGSSAYGIRNSSTGTVTVTGNVTGGSDSYAYGIHNYFTGTVIVTGNVIPDTSTTVSCVYNASTGRCYINGDVYGGRNAASVYADNGLIVINGTLKWDEAYSNTVAAGSSVSGKIVLNGNIEHRYATTGYYGMTLTSGRLLMRNGANTYTAYAEDDGTGVATGNPVMHYGTNLHTGAMPNESDVRYNVSYGPGGSRVGTCHVPPPQSVAYGVPVDHTTGMAVLTLDDVAAAVWDELRSKHTTTGTYGAVSEWAGGGSGSADWTDTEKNQIRYRLGIDGTIGAPVSGTPHLGSTYSTLDDIGAAVNTRLASEAYTAPDNANISAIKAAIEQYLDAAISSRMAGSDYVPPDNASIAAIKTQTDKLTFDASNYVYATGLGGGGSVQVVVQPLATRVLSPESDGGAITLWRHARLRATWHVNANLEGHDLRLIVFRYDDPAEAVTECKGDEISITLQDDGSSVVAIDASDSKIPDTGIYAYVLRDQTVDSVLLAGRCVVKAAPDASA